jgi:hypothetical protein
MIAKRRWTLSIIAGGAPVVFAVSSIVSLVGFSASNRVVISALHKQEGEAILQRHEAAVNARLEHAAWLRRTSVDRELPKAERKQLLAEVGEQIKALANVELPKLDAAMVTPDGHAALFASLTGLKTEQVQLSFAIFTAVRQRPADSQRQSEAVDKLSERKQRQAVRKFFQGNSGVAGMQGGRDRSLRRLS